MLNKFFSHNKTASSGFTNEQSLIRDMVRETIQVAGLHVRYIKRSASNVDSIFDDAEEVSYSTSYELEVYLQDTAGFGGMGDEITRFGYEVQDECTLTIAVDRFEALLGAGQSPVLGDLIYLPLSNQMYQIIWVEDQDPFFTLGKTFVWQVTCQLFQYADQDFNTGVDAIDALEAGSSYVIDLTLKTGGTGSFTAGSTVYQGSVGSETVKAEVISWTSGTRILRVMNISGAFAADVVITDGTASWTIESFDDQTMPTDDFAQNLEFESAESGVVDFTESNPFGEF
tara:strand:- start:1363 stop:2217 length:855 start_codon:yes stop_codon:yes gene_type:complete